MDHHDHDDFGGLARDVKTMSRRRMFGWLAGLALVPVFVDACTGSGSGETVAGPDAAGGSGACPSEVPAETGGPYPGDGTNGPNALTLGSALVRSDIRTSVGSASGVASGVAFRLTITLVDQETCAPLVGHAVYIWHCTVDGDYSMYTGAAVGENYLRGVQVTDANGQVTFTTIFPGCYSGRWPHIHFEVYASIADATSGTKAARTSQLAMPKATCDVVYATAGYASSITNLSQTSLATDMVFSDGATLQLPAIAGTVGGADFAGAITVAV